MFAALKARLRGVDGEGAAERVAGRLAMRVLRPERASGTLFLPPFRTKPLLLAALARRVAPANLVRPSVADAQRRS